MKSRLPTIHKLPKAYVTWLYREVNKESWREWANRQDTTQIPQQKKVKIPFTTATAYIFGKNFIKHLLA